MNSNRVRDCLLSIRAAVMAIHAWTKLGHMHGLHAWAKLGHMHGLHAWAKQIIN